MGIFKNFLLKQALKSKMKNVPEAERDRLLALMDEHPEFFKKIGDKVEKRIKAGQGETAAAMVVMREHQAELQKLLR